MWMEILITWKMGIQFFCSTLWQHCNSVLRSFTETLIQETGIVCEYCFSAYGFTLDQEVFKA